MFWNGKESSAFDDIHWSGCSGSNDSQRITYCAKRGEQYIAVIDGQEGPSYDEWFDTHCTRDGSHVYFEAIRSGQQLVWCDGREFPLGEIVDKRHHEYAPVRYDDIAHKLYYRSKRGDQWTLVIDGLAGPVFDDIEDPVFSPDGQHIAYSAQRGKQWCVVVDGKPGPWFDRTYVPVFSPNSKRVAYCARCGAKKRIVIDGNAGSLFYDMRNDLLFFTPDSKHITFNIKDSSHAGWRMCIDGRVDPMEGDQSLPIFSRDSKHIGYGFSSEEGHQFIIVDSKIALALDGVWEPIFSPNNNHIAAIVECNHEQSVVLDGQVGQHYDKVLHVEFSPDGKHLAIVANRNKHSYLIIDGQEVKSYNEFDEIQTLRPTPNRITGGVNHRCSTDEINCNSFAFYADGSQVSFFAKRSKKQVLVIEGQECESYENFDQETLSPDGKHIAAMARKDTTTVLLVDGREIPQYRCIFNLHYEQDNTLHFHAYRDHKFREVALPADGQSDGVSEM